MKLYSDYQTALQKRPTRQRVARSGAQALDQALAKLRSSASQAKVLLLQFLSVCRSCPGRWPISIELPVRVGQKIGHQ